MFHHITVLLNETVDMLDIKKDGVYVDCTLGGAGHSLYLVKQLSDSGRLIAIDQDDTALNNAKEVLKEHLHKVTLVKNNFRNLRTVLDELNIDKVDGILYDLGVSSPQLDDAERGFSYHQEARLDMRMDRTQDLSAYEVVNEWPYEKLVSIFYRYGEEKFSKQIARNIEKQEKQSRLKRRYSSLKSLKKASRPRHDVKAVIQPKESFRLSE